MKKRIFLPPFLFITTLPFPNSCFLVAVDPDRQRGEQALEALNGQVASTTETGNLEHKPIGERLIFRQGMLVQLPKTERGHVTRH